MNWRSRYDLLYTASLALLVELCSIAYQYEVKLGHSAGEYFSTTLGTVMLYGGGLLIALMWMRAVNWAMHRGDRVWRYGILLVPPLMFPYYFLVVRREI